MKKKNMSTFLNVSVTEILSTFSTQNQDSAYNIANKYSIRKLIDLFILDFQQNLCNELIMIETVTR